MEPKKRVRATRWLLAGCTLLLAVMLILQCLSIYRAGTSPENLTEAGVRIHDIFSREIVGERLASVAWAFGLWLAALAVAMVDGMRHPEPKGRPGDDPEIRLKLMEARREITPEMARQRRVRRGLNLGEGCFLAICAAGAGAYLFNIEHFTSWDLESVMGGVALNVFPWILIAFAGRMIFAELRYRSVVKSVELAKNAPKKPVEKPPEKRSYAGLARMALYAAGIAMVAAGVFNGGMYDVLVKAINICTECIGLG